MFTSLSKVSWLSCSGSKTYKITTKNIGFTNIIFGTLFLLGVAQAVVRIWSPQVIWCPWLVRQDRAHATWHLLILSSAAPDPRQIRPTLRAENNPGFQCLHQCKDQGGIRCQDLLQLADPA
jgi:hypothetical protein